MASLWVVNASPIILLSKVSLVDVLRELGAPVAIPHAAVIEISKRGPSDSGVQALARSTWLAQVDPGPIPPRVAAFGLGAGESSVITYALAHPGSGVVFDDRAARKAAAALSIPHQGTLSLILLAKARGLVAAARPILEQLRRDGMYLSDQIIKQTLAQVGE